MLYGGSIMPGQYDGHDITIQDVFEAVGACAAGRMTEEQLKQVENGACPGRRSLWWTVHSQYHVHRRHISRHVANERK